MRNALILGLLAIASASLAVAQIPSGNVFVGYQYLNADLSSSRSNMSGWTGSVEGKLIPFLGFVADFGEGFGSVQVPILCPGPPCPTVGINAHEYNMVFGPRVSFSAGKVRPFAEAMFGFGHVSTNGVGSDTAFATAIGGGFDYKIIPLIGWRVEGDYLQTRFFSSTQNNFRLSTGIVIHF